MDENMNAGQQESGAVLDDERLVKYHSLMLLIVGLAFSVVQGIQYGIFAPVVIIAAVSVLYAFMVLTRRVIPLNLRIHIISVGSFFVAFGCSAAINAIHGFALLLSCCIVSALYFRKSVIIVMAIVVNITVIVGILILQLGLPGEFDMSWFINNLISLNCGIAVLYAVSSIGKGFIDKITQKSRETEELNKTIMSSIDCARKIQKSLLPLESVMEAALTDYSVIWKPRDVVGGDTYWMKRFDKGAVLCVCDCTEHGSPGALLTMLVESTLESVIRPDNCGDTAGIIWKLDQRLSEAFHVEGGMDATYGCDIAALFIANDGTVKFSSVMIPIFVCDGKEVMQYEGQRAFVGVGSLKSKDEVDVHSIPANADNKFYIVSDGLFEQIGEDVRGQFGYEAFKRIILENHVEKQAVITGKIWDAYEEYCGEQAQPDDIELVAFTPRVIWKEPG